MTGLISLVLSAIIGLRALTHHGHKSPTYEIVSKPIYTRSSSHSIAHEDHHGGGYGHSSYVVKNYNQIIVGIATRKSDIIMKPSAHREILCEEKYEISKDRAVRQKKRKRRKIKKEEDGSKGKVEEEDKL
nr:unnamed protein product [Callosobruchus analis]